MDHCHPSRRLATGLLPVTLAVVMAACGSSGVTSSPPAASPGIGAAVDRAAGSPAPSSLSVPSSTPSPSPTPNVDVPRAFIAIMTTRPFSAEMTLAGEMTVGATTYPVTGTLAVNGPDSHQSMTISVGGTPQNIETTTVSGVSYVRRGGLWFQKEATSGAGSGSSLGSALQSLLEVADTGVETRNGQPLHHLKSRSDAPIPLSAIGMDDPVGDGRATFDFYARDDGTPVVMATTWAWTQAAGTARTPVSMTIDFTFTKVGGVVAIVAPSDVWTTFTSKRFGYSVAYPADWEANQAAGNAKPDTLLSANDSVVHVYRDPISGYTLNGVTSIYVDTLKRLDKAGVTSNQATKVAGVAARRLEWTAVYKGTREWDIEVVVVRGTFVYFFDYSSLSKTTDADRAFVDQLISSVTLPGPATSTSSAGNQTS